MMRSLSSGVAGLRSHQTKMDVIGTNIANVNTFGFKSSRVTFSDVYYQTLSSGSAPSNVMGGTNPTQIGYGSAVATIDVMNAQSGLSSTDRAMDLYINGDGMLATKDANGNLFYTRLGVTGFDADGNLVDGNGNFIMGFPMDPATGKPVINPDGTIDIEDLSRITVDKAMLDKMTNISIGTTGEIVGTLAGDTEITVSKKLPGWLVDVQIDPESDIVGDVKVTMEYRSTFDPANLPNWITSMTPKANSMLEDVYEFSFDGSTIKAVNPNTNDILTGTYRKNGTVNLSNAKGETVLTIQTDMLNEPNIGAAGDATFTIAQMLRVDWTDKGGNADFAEVEYKSQKGDIVLGDVTLTLDPDSATDITTAKLVYDTSNSFDVTNGGFIEGVYLDSASLYNTPSLQLGVGVLKNVTKGISGNAYLKFMVNNTNLDTYEDMCKTLSENMPLNSEIQVEIVQNASDFQYVLKDKSTGSVLASSAPISDDGDPVIFTDANNASNTWTFTTVGSEQFKVATESGTGLNATTLKNLINSSAAIGDYTLEVTGGGPYTVELRGPGGVIGSATNVSLGDNIVFGTGSSAVTLGSLTQALIDGAGGTGVTLAATVAPPVLNNPQTFAKISETNTLRLYDDSGRMLAEAAYSGQSVISLGDMSLTVDKTAIQAQLALRENVEDSGSWVTIGDLDRTTGPDWQYSGTVANAQPGAGEAITIGVIAMAKIPNMVAMQQSGSSYFVTTANSGEASFMRPGINGTGNLQSGYLEMSNVDVSKEFTEMITTQRGFQANTRIITVSDEMLNELVNLKR